MRILVVEDEWLVALGIEKTLIASGLSIVGVCGSVRAALALIAAKTCDVAVLDANLGGESAEPVADALYELGIPFVVVSGYASSQRLGRLATAPFVRKPFKPPELLQMIGQLATNRAP